MPITLTEEHKKKIDKWFKDNPIIGVCPACKNQPNWSIRENIYNVTRLYDMGPSKPETYLPLIAFVCDVCAYVRFFDARKMGVVS
jgi:hypothetical protein